MTVVVAHPSECQMSKRKPATAQKRARSPKTAKAQRAKQAIVRSPKDSRLRSVAAGSTESLLQRHSDSKTRHLKNHDRRCDYYHDPQHQ
jgi:hypothetical protein